MNLPKVSWLGLPLMAALSALASSPADAGVGLGAGWRTVKHGLDPSATWGSNAETFVAPALQFLREGNSSQARLGWRQEVLLHRTFPNATTIASPHWGSGTADLDLVHAGAAGTVRGSGHYVRSVSALDATAPVSPVSGSYTNWSAGARVSMSLVEAGGRLSGWVYDDPSLTHSTELTLDGNIVPLRTERGAALLGWRHRQIQTGGPNVLRSDMAVVGARRELAQQLALQLEVGASEVVLGADPAQKGPAFAVRLFGPNGDRSPLRASLAHQKGLPLETLVFADRTTGQYRLTASWESQLDAEGGKRSTPAFVRRLGFAVEDSLTRLTILGGEVSGARMWSVTPPQTRTDALRFGGWLVRRLMPWLAFRLEYSQLFEAEGTTLRKDTPRWYRLSGSLAIGEAR